MALGLSLLAIGCSKPFTLSKDFQDSIGDTPSPTLPTPQPTPVVPPDLTNPRNSASVFITGHSLTDFLPNFLPNLTLSVGDTFQFNFQFIPGSPIAARTRGNESNPNWDGYTSGSNFNGSNMNVVSELLNPTTIVGRYDSLVIAERHDILGPLQYHDTVRYLRNYHDRFISGNAQGQTYFYEAWWNLNRDNPAPWISYERAASTAWQCIGTRINRSLELEGRTDRLRQIPAGAALAELVNQATTSNLSGITLGSVRATMDSLFSDDVHTTALGSYYMSLVTYAFLYRKTPASTAVPAGITANAASSLKSVAWNFVTNYHATNVPLTLAQCQSYMSDNFCSAAWTFAGSPGNATGCGTFYNQQNNSNPFYFNASSDSSYWFTGPPGL